MARTDRTNAHAFTLRARHGKGLITIPITIFCESNSVSAAGHSHASGRDLHGIGTATPDTSAAERLMIEKNKRIIELSEHVSELKARLRKYEQTPDTSTT